MERCLFISEINPLNAELNSICHLLALLGTHHIVHVSRIRVKKVHRPSPTETCHCSQFWVISKLEQICSIIQAEHKVFTWLQTFITRKLPYVEYKHIFFLPLLKLVSKILCHVFIVTFVTFGFWMQHFQTGGLGETVRHPGHHDHRISHPLTPFYGGMLRTKWFRHQFQILQIWRQE